MKGLNQSRFLQAEQARNVWVINPEHGVQPVDILERHYLSHVAKFLRPYDKIEARAEDGSWYAEFRVIDAGMNWASLTPTYQDGATPVKDLSTVVLSDHEVVWKGPHYKWVVLRKSDKSILKDQMTKPEAFKWLGNYEQTINKPMLKAVGFKESV